MAYTMANQSTDSCIKIKKTRHFYPFQYFQMNLFKKKKITNSLSSPSGLNTKLSARRENNGSGFNFVNKTQSLILAFWCKE